MADSRFQQLYEFLNKTRTVDWPADVGSELLCTLCEKVLVNACQLFCGCRLCSACVDDLFAMETKVCPGKTKYCSADISCDRSDIQPDYRANKLVSMLTTKCPIQNCEFRCQLINMEEHFESCCNNRCPFVEWGCQNQSVTIDEHMLVAGQSHGKMVMDNFNIVLNEVALLRKTVSEKSVEIESLKNINFVYEEQMRSMLEEVEMLKIQVTQLPRSSPETGDSFVTNFLWSIDQVSSVRLVGRRIWSDIFYSKPTGYQLRLLLYPNGYGEVAGKALTVYLYVSANITQKWPFTADVNMKVVNHKISHRSLTAETRCILNRPVFFNWSEPFNFLYESLVTGSVFVGDCFDIQCTVREISLINEMG